jgi:hypothetical protein
MTPPCSSADYAFDALALAGALMMQAQGRSAALRMQTLACARRAGFVRGAPRHDILAAMDAHARLVPGDTAWRRRLVARAMTPLVGSDWAPAVLRAAGEIGAASGPLNAGARAALRGMAAALALPG